VKVVGGLTIGSLHLLPGRWYEVRGHTTMVSLCLEQVETNILTTENLVS
jgi:hypothetical protein